MSQAKVDAYKAEKKNRKKNVKRDRLKMRLYGVLGVVVCVGIVGYIGYSAYGVATANAETPRTEISMDAINDYMDTID